MNNEKLTKKDLRRMFWRQQINQFSSNYERGMAISFLYSMKPALNRWYRDRPIEERQKAYERYLGYFGTHPTLFPFIVGSTAAMEENTSEDEKEAIVALKTSLMGPLAGVGDSLLNFTWYPIAGAIGASFAVQGNFIGPILMFLMINLLYFPLKWFGLQIAYKKGTELLSGEGGKKIIDRITNMASVVGMMVGAALITTAVNVSVGFKFGKGNNVIKLQEMLDKIMPNMIPLILTIFCVWFIRKFEGKYITQLIFSILIIGVLLSYFGILA